MSAQCKADECERTVLARGLCPTHYSRWWKNGDLTYEPDPSQRHYVRGTPEQRWNAKYVVQEDGCWLWLGRLNAHGYGVFGGGSSVEYAHRFGYELHVGPIPEGLELDHLCRTRNCVRPDHLEAVTRRTNQLRGYSPAGINARKTHCPQGHEYTADNLVGGVSGRSCKACHRDRERARYRAKVGRTT